MKSFSEIGQFRNAIREIKSHCDYHGKDENGDVLYKHKQPYPTLKFRGTIKLHGTNAAIVAYKDGFGDLSYVFQSRENELNLVEDNAGFMNSMVSKDYKSLFNGIEFNESCAIYGEWCGGNIQKNVAINGLPKMFVIFAVRIDNVYQDMLNYKHLNIQEQHIYNILEFKTFEISIDINAPELTQNKLVELTEEVEKECPVGKYFGISGVGEGIVWESIDTNRRYIFKVKGEKHQNSRVKTLTTVNTEEIENINEFIAYAVTENRLAQGIDKMKEMNIPLDMKSTPQYLRWVYNDVIKEENDTIIENGIDPKKIGSAISNKARIYWFEYLNKNY